MIGTTIANYRITAELGAGGMGVVYKATDLTLDREVALKFLGSAFSGSTGAKARFVHEARAASALDHPNICTIHGIEEAADGRLFIVMACYEGVTLKQRIAQGALTVPEAADIALQMAHGLAKAHRFGIVHRDVKPANVMVTSDGLVKLLDFGIAKLTGLTQLTRTGTALGTAHYMSPEQMAGTEADRRADVWSLGVVLYEMLSGRLPFTGDNAAAVAYAVMHLEPEPLKDLVPGLPADLARAIDGCLRKDPSERHAGVEPLVPVLQPWAGALDATVILERTAGRRLLADAAGASPYPGLASFSEADSEYFHGRESQVEALWQKLRRNRLLAVAGPSGVGKTSFLRAGLIAAKPRDWGFLVATPGGSPLMSLRRELVRELSGDTEAMLALVQDNDPDTQVALVRRWRQKHAEALVVVDQFEELFTLSRSEEQALFAELLSRLTFEAEVHVLVSLRDDFLHHCRDHAGLLPVFESLTMLAPLGGQALRRALVQPALDCGYRFEDESLIDEMIAQVERERGVLPLLAFAMAGLWAGRDRERGLITRRAYTQLGEVCGALPQHAEAVMREIGDHRHDLVRELFRNLVTAQGTRAVLDRDQLLSVFPATSREAAEQVLGRMIDGRLLISYEVMGDDGRGCNRLEIIHESLLSAWPRLVRWRTQDADGAQLRDQLRQAAQAWQDRGRSADLLWRGAAYREYAVWRERYGGALTALEEAYAGAMAARERRRRRRRRLAATAAFAALCGVILVIGWSLRGERIARQRVEASRLLALGRAELAADPSAARAYAIASLGMDDSPAGRRFALEVFARGPAARILPTTGNFQATHLDFSPDGERLVAGGFGGVWVFAADGSPPIVLEDYFPSRHDTREPRFAPDGDRVVFTAGGDRSRVRVWSLREGREVRTFRMEGATLLTVKGGRLFLVTDATGRCEYPGILADAPLDEHWPGQWAQAVVRVWDFDASEPRVVGHWDLAGVSWFDIDPAGSRVAYAKGRGVFVAPVAEFGAGALRVGDHAADVVKVAFGPGGERLAAADADGGIRIWRVRGAPGRPWRSIDTTAPVHGLWFDPTGARLAAACGAGKKIRVWDLDGPAGADPVSLRHRDARIFPGVAFSPDGRQLAVAHFDRISVWTVDPPDPYVLHSPSSKLFQGLAFTPDGRKVVGLQSTSVQVWDLGGEPPLRHPPAAESGGQGGILDPSGRCVVMSTIADGILQVSLMDGSARRLPGSDHAGTFSAPALSADGQVAAATDREFRIWDLSTLTWRSFANPAGQVMSLRFGGDGRLFSGHADGEIHRWDTRTGTGSLVHTCALPLVASLCVSSDGRLLIANAWPAGDTGSSFKSELTAVDVASGEARPVSGHGVSVDYVTIDSGDDLLLTADAENVVRVGPLAGGEPHQLIGSESAWVIAISPDRRWIAVGSDDSEGTVSLWRMPDGEPWHTRARDELLRRLGASTNLRVVGDDDAQNGYRLVPEPLPGWTEPEFR